MTPTRHLRPWLGVLCAALLLGGCGFRRDGFDFGRMVLFSAVAGQIVRNGQPVAGATVTRHANFHGEEHTDSTVTDAHGNFRFGTMKTFTLLFQVLPSEPVVPQNIIVAADGSTQKIWSHVKRGYEDNNELWFHIFHLETPNEYLRVDAQTDPIRVVCTLGAEPKLVGDIWGTCDFIGNDGQSAKMVPFTPPSY
ncbi:MAG: carboxypeptidase regulatory-like domain-containing protein [Proteobacteria bacterium]|nr:carboxypeptidase regulatory-like domain-containing protein [Pseudomonadota bacterium]